jgi:phenylpropionate dioxygenase-like ring-hydroxylating dioxygenase large terminal subunit
MKLASSVLAAFIVAFALVSTAEAHHSAAVFYAMDKEVTVEGVVTSYTLGNPHARIYMTVKGPNGEDQKWLAEGGSRTVLLRNGWSGDEVKPGDRIKIVGNPSRDGSFVVHGQKLVLGDGKELWGEDVPTPNELEELRHRSN